MGQDRDAGRSSDKFDRTHGRENVFGDVGPTAVADPLVGEGIGGFVDDAGRDEGGGDVGAANGSATGRRRGAPARLLRCQLAACYRSGDYEPRGPSFHDFVRSQPPREIQDANLAAWKALLADHPIPGPPLRFPGGVTKAAFRIDGYYDATFTSALADDVTAAVKHTCLSRAELLTAATGLAVGVWSDAPQPMLSIRHGHTRPEDILVIGPLFGPNTRAVTAPRDLLAPLWTDERPAVPSTAAFWINFFLSQPGRIEVSITHHRDVLPEPQILADTVRAVVAAAAHQPDARLGVLRAQLRW